MLGRVPTVHIDDQNLNRMQGNIIQGLNQLRSIPLLDGLFYRNVSLQIGSNAVQHGLGRPFIGYIITRMTAGVTIYNNQGTADSSLYVVLEASGAVTIDLWVF